MDTIILQRKFKHVYPNGREIHATAKLYSIGQQEPYFSITGEVWRGKPRPNGSNLESCGCCHEQIAKTFPALSRFIPLHLCDSSGAPMHTVANAEYHAGLSGDDLLPMPANHLFLANHLRIDEGTAAAIVEQVKGTPNHDQLKTGMDNAECEQMANHRRNSLETLHRFIEEQRPRWQQEAEEFKTFLGAEDQEKETK